MKPFDSKGEYTPDEVKAALAGIDGTRQFSFRYERLDRNDTFIESLDYVQSCTIENNALADIKRTAKFDILDTGRMNYLSDRIKPYIRLQMPTDETYATFASNLNPSTWWKMDDPDQTLVYTTVVNPVDDTSYSTFSTAYNMNEGDQVAAFVYPPGTVGKRSVYWAKLTVSTSNAIDIRAMIANSSSAGVQTTLKSVYTQPSTGSTEGSLVPLSDVNASSAYNIEQLYPSQVTYYFKFENVSDSAKQQVQLSWGRPRRLSDSSVNGNHGFGTGIYLQKPSIVKDGGKAISAAGHVTTPIRSFDCGTVMSGSLWYTPSDIPRRVVVSEYWDTEGPYEAGKGQSDLEFWADFDLGTINIYGGFDAYSFDVRLTKTIGVQALTKVRHYAWSMDWINNRFSVWLDGVRHVLTIAEHGSGTADTTKIPVTNLANRIDLNCTTGSSNPNFVDDVLVFTGKELSDTDAKTLYSLGVTYTSARSGYVEWPQGVFVLSSPKRTMVDGNYVHRDVEGYDKLVTLKEDSFDYRYAVAAGSKYTDAVRRVLQTSASREKYPFSDLTMWSGTVSTVAVTANDRVEMTATSSTDAAGMKTNESSLVMDSLDVSAKMTVPAGNDYTIIQVNVAIDTGTESLQIQVDNANYFKVTKGSTILTYLTYNPATMVYWRIRESVGTIYWEYSADGLTWTSFWSMVSPYSPDATIRVAFISSTVNATAVADKVSVVGTRALKHAITKSTATLPTAMDWEVGTPKLQIINDMLGAINYDSASYNEEGVFVTRPYIAPDKRSSQFTYATDQSSVIRGDVDQTIDIFKIPNKFICVVSDPDRPALVGTYTNNNPLSPTSTVSRGRTIVDYRSEQSAPDQATLDGIAARLAFEASQVYEVIEFETGVMPIHQNADVYTVSIDGLSVNDKYSEHKWSIELAIGGSMTHTIRKVVSL